MSKVTLGILGAGKFGTALGRLAVEAGYKVLIAGSGSVDKIALTVEILVPNAIPLTGAEVVAQADIIILTLPLSKYKSINKKGLENKIVIDAMNYWREVDGVLRIPESLTESSSQLIADYLKDSLVVKAFNHLGYHDLEIEAKEKGKEMRKAIAYATDSISSISIIEELISNIGFDSLFIGSLQNGIKLEPGSPLFGANLPLKKLEEEINNFYKSDFGKEVLKAEKMKL